MDISTTSVIMNQYEALLVQLVDTEEVHFIRASITDGITSCNFVNVSISLVHDYSLNMLQQSQLEFTFF